MIKEACVENLQQAVRAEQKGADRLELCARLDLGGISPNPALIKAVQDQTSIPIKVMIRARGGSFHYRDSELQKMIETISYCKAIGIPELVMGVLTSEGNQIDIASMQLLAAAAGQLPITFHKAIDECADILLELERLRSISLVKSILSSGGALTAIEGRDMLHKMHTSFGQRFTIIAAGKVTRENLPDLHAKININEYHGRKIVGEV